MRECALFDLDLRRSELLLNFLYAFLTTTFVNYDGKEYVLVFYNNTKSQVSFLLMGIVACPKFLMVNYILQ